MGEIMRFVYTFPEVEQKGLIFSVCMMLNLYSHNWNFTNIVHLSWPSSTSLYEDLALRLFLIDFGDWLLGELNMPAQCFHPEGRHVQSAL